ncbi:MAG: hypothetical protein FJ130_02670 [Deltaproteobacteria bacterium]|nr:hypothetical protein [Deltaproteobacteria bacterium]
MNSSYAEESDGDSCGSFVTGVRKYFDTTIHYPDRLFNKLALSFLAFRSIAKRTRMRLKAAIVIIKAKK